MRFEREMILGAMVFVGAAILVLGSMWLSESFWGPAGGYKLVTVFESVMGLNKGDPVTMRGVHVGKVLSIYMDRGQPMVQIGFREERNLPRDSEVILRSAGMLGERVIEVRRGNSDRAFQDGDMVIGRMELGIEELLSDAAEATGQLKAAVDSIVAPENVRSISNSIQRVDGVTRDLQEVMDANRGRLDATLKNLAEASSDASGILSGNRDRIEGSIASLDSTAQSLAEAAGGMKRAADGLERTMNNLEEITRKMNDGEGTIGRLLNDEGLYNRLDGVVTTADSLLEAVKRDPGRYMNFKFTIF